MTTPDLPAGESIYAGKNETAPPPPPPTYNPYTNSRPGMPGGPQGYIPPSAPNTYAPPAMATSSPIATPSPTGGTYQQVPDYARKPKKSNCGCITLSVILLIVLGAGVGGYFLVSSFINKGANQNQANTSPSGNTTSGTTQGSTSGNGSSAGSTEQLNLQFTYANVNITLLSAQIANSFPDDTGTSGSAGMLRLSLRENNPTTRGNSYLESDVMLLLLPGGNTLKPYQEKLGIGPDASINRQNWLDFQINSPVKINQLALRVGSPSENQLTIPLQANANLSKYQDRTSNPNISFKYGELNMTLKTATLSYSYNTTQATQGNRYIILTLAAVNNTANSISIYPPSYMRLQAGGNSVQPDNTYTIPYSIDGNTSATGIVAFLVPDNVAVFTLVMLAQDTASPPISQVTQPFQVQ